MIQTPLRRARRPGSAGARVGGVGLGRVAARSAAAAASTRSRWARSRPRSPASASRIAARGRRRRRARAARAAGARGRPGRRARAASRARTRRCPRTASWLQAGPRPAALTRPRRRRQVGAVDRRAAGRVGDDHPVAEELADELDVRRLAAAAAGAGELEQRLEHLRALDRVVRQRVRSSAGSTGRSPSSAARRRGGRRRGSMLIALWLDVGLALGRADVDAHAAAGAVVGRDLDRQRCPGRSRDRNSL